MPGSARLEPPGVLTLLFSAGEGSRGRARLRWASADSSRRRGQVTHDDRGLGFPISRMGLMMPAPASATGCLESTHYGCVAAVIVRQLITRCPGEAPAGPGSFGKTHSPHLQSTPEKWVGGEPQVTRREKAEAVPRPRQLCGGERDARHTWAPRWVRGVEGGPI